MLVLQEIKIKNKRTNKSKTQKNTLLHEAPEFIYYRSNKERELSNSFVYSVFFLF